MAAEALELAEGIDDPSLRERFLSALSGGPPLSEKELFFVVAGGSDAGWRRRVLDRACPDPVQRRAVEALVGAAVVTRELLDPIPNGDLVARALPQMPERIGKYRIERYLGGGGFGHVWMGYDDDLTRHVAIKVPRTDTFAGPEEAAAFLEEARTAAVLRHPNIVRVYDVGRLDHGAIYVVSDYIAGETLHERLARERPPVEEVARLVATVARALNEPHGQRLVHRDVKPANILVESATGIPYVTDFGLAVAQERSLSETRIAGTPAYMSPEQARGEPLDARSDIFALGAVLYESLTGRKAFAGGSQREILALVARGQPVAPRECDPTIPAEVERICLRALEKEPRDRHQSAAELAEELETWLADRSSGSAGLPAVPVVPKGLRSFDGDDAGFFLQLLPGPRGRDGLPETVRFWKTRLDETDPAKTFAIGLLYGPSGCGKSSLIRAGIVPRLASGIATVVIDATPDDTEAQLLAAIRAVADLPQGAGLVESFARLREAKRGKVVVVFDQFEQWLQAHPDPESTVLAAALRHCDGGRVQALLSVRDDFGLAAGRFLKAAGARIEEGRNYATFDAFPADHGRNVLVRFGQGLGRLPNRVAEFSAGETAFLDQAIAGLAGDEKRVVPVQLALFSDLVKTRPWTPATLAELGEATGGSRRLLDRVGVAFLADAFDARSANPAHRACAAVAKRVLEALLPDSGTQIKGHKRSAAELRAASANDNSRGEFGDVLRILDGELRLITPTDPPGEDSSKSAGGTAREGYYQLTHDYLVPALRDWLTAGRRTTAKGRAELVLAERTANWTERKQETQQLPGLLEWLRIRWFTRADAWRPAERRMMARADRFHGRRGLSAAALVAAVLAGGIAVRLRVVESERRLAADGAVMRLLDAEMMTVEEPLKDLADLAKYTSAVLPKLESVMTDGDKASQRLKAALGLARIEGAPGRGAATGASTYLAERLLVAEPYEVAPIVTALSPQWGSFAARFAAVAADPAVGQQRLRAAALVAAFDPEGEAWTKLAPPLAADLVNVPAVYLATWLDAFRGVRGKLVPAIVPIFADPNRREIERSLAADILADYAADEPAVLADLAMSAEPSQFATLAARIEAQSEAIAPRLEAEIAKTLPEEMPLVAPERETLGIRQAKAAAVLMWLGRPERAWPLLIHSPDPRGRSYLIHFVKPFAGERLGDVAKALVDRLDAEADVSAKRGIVLALGEVLRGEEPGRESPGGAAISTLRGALVPVLQEIFETDPDPGLHSAAEWTLKQVGEREWVTKRVEAWRTEAAAANAVDPPQLAALREELSKNGPQSPRWFMNSQGQTFTMVPAPGLVEIGSPEGEKSREEDENKKEMIIPYDFAVSLTPVTWEQFDAWQPDGDEDVLQLTTHRQNEILSFDALHTQPVVALPWQAMARYCNWLSDQEGIPRHQWCYEEAEGHIRTREGYLGLAGYRLPTEIEIEYVVRAGAETSRYYGETATLLDDYAWYNTPDSDNQATREVAQLKPNDFGLFDALGNCWVAVHSRDGLNGNLGTRGGGWKSFAGSIRSANVNNLSDCRQIGETGDGFRLARTLTTRPFGYPTREASPPLSREAGAPAVELGDEVLVSE